MKPSRCLAAICLAAAVTFVSQAKAENRPINLKLSYWVPPSHPLTPAYKDWVEAVQKASNGSITVTLFPSSQLGSGPDHYDIVKRGIADIGQINPGYTPGRFPVLATSDLPFMISDSMKAAPALSRWYQRYASKEMADHYVCHVFTHIPGTIHSKTPIRVPADLKGLNVRTANQTTAQYITSAGGNSVQVPIMESYEALNRGVADSIMVTWAGLTHPAFRFGQVTSYTLDVPLYVSTFTTGISKKTFDAMSASQQQAIASVCTPEWSAKMTSYWYEDDNSREQEIRKSDRKVVKPTPEETVLWRKAAEPVIASWKESVGKAGYDADQVMTDFQKELRDAGALF